MPANSPPSAANHHQLIDLAQRGNCNEFQQAYQVAKKSWDVNFFHETLLTLVLQASRNAHDGKIVHFLLNESNVNESCAVKQKDPKKYHNTLKLALCNALTQGCCSALIAVTEHIERIKPEICVELISKSGTGPSLARLAEQGKTDKLMYMLDKFVEVGFTINKVKIPCTYNDIAHLVDSANKAGQQVIKEVVKHNRVHSELVSLAKQGEVDKLMLLLILTAECVSVNQLMNILEAAIQHDRYNVIDAIQRSGYQVRSLDIIQALRRYITDTKLTADELRASLSKGLKFLYADFQREIPKAVDLDRHTRVKEALPELLKNSYLRIKTWQRKQDFSEKAKLEVIKDFQGFLPKEMSTKELAILKDILTSRLKSVALYFDLSKVNMELKLLPKGKERWYIGALLAEAFIQSHQAQLQNKQQLAGEKVKEIFRAWQGFHASYQCLKARLQPWIGRWRAVNKKNEEKANIHQLKQGFARFKHKLHELRSMQPKEASLELKQGFARFKRKLQEPKPIQPRQTSLVIVSDPKRKAFNQVKRESEFAQSCREGKRFPLQSSFTHWQSTAARKKVIKQAIEKKANKTVYGHLSKIFGEASCCDDGQAKSLSVQEMQELIKCIQAERRQGLIDCYQPSTEAEKQENRLCLDQKSLYGHGTYIFPPQAKIFPIDACEAFVTTQTCQLKLNFPFKVIFSASYPAGLVEVPRQNCRNQGQQAVMAAEAKVQQKVLGKELAEAEAQVVTTTQAEITWRNRVAKAEAEVVTTTQAERTRRNSEANAETRTKDITTELKMAKNKIVNLEGTIVDLEGRNVDLEGKLQSVESRLGFIMMHTEGAIKAAQRGAEGGPSNSSGRGKISRGKRASNAKKLA